MQTNNIDDEKQQLIVFKLEEKMYGVDIGQVREITRVGEISPVPNSPSYILGVTNLRGQVTTVVDLRMRLGMSPKTFDRLSRMMIIECGGLSEGVIVDSVAEVTMMAKKDIEDTPEIVKSSESTYIKGIGKKENQLIILVDLRRLLTGESSEPNEPTLEMTVAEPEKIEVKAPSTKRK